MSTEEILAAARERGVKIVRLQFLDILGVVKSVAIPVGQLPRALANHVTFDGSSIEGFARIEESDMILRPVPETFAVLPWAPPEQTEAQMLCEVYTLDGLPFAGDPRSILRRTMEEVRDAGFTAMLAVECEFFLFQQNQSEAARPETVDRGGYFDLSPSDRGEAARRALVLSLEEMGYGVDSSHHEAAPGQHEVDLGWAEPMVLADRLVTLRALARAVADSHGLAATFMPKPLAGMEGSSLHTQIMLQQNGRNACHDPNGPHRLSAAALHFIGGLLTHAREITAFLNPLVNSYKRLVPGFEAPVEITWSVRNRNALVRVPGGRGEETRLELRSPDPSCNPYLAFAVILQAGLDGIRKKTAPPKPVAGVMQGDTAALPEEATGVLPLDLREALDEAARSELVRRTVGEHVLGYFLAAKTIEWDIYRTQVHRWELEQYLRAF